MRLRRLINQNWQPSSSQRRMNRPPAGCDPMKLEMLTHQVNIRTGQMRDWCNVTLTNDVCTGSRKSNGTQQISSCWVEGLIIFWIMLNASKCHQCECLDWSITPGNLLIFSMVINGLQWSSIVITCSGDFRWSCGSGVGTMNYDIPYAALYNQELTPQFCRNQGSWQVDVGIVKSYQVSSTVSSTKSFWFGGAMPPVIICDPLQPFWSCKK